RHLPVLQMREHHTWIAKVEGSMCRRDQRVMSILLEAVGLGPVSQMLSITLDHGLLTALSERWHSESQCFRLLTGEMTVTLEDIWQILRMLIMGTLIKYNSNV
ncbi:hypothetical protein KI387_017056, partial [Taxus chinensis]